MKRIIKGISFTPIGNELMVTVNDRTTTFERAPLSVMDMLLDELEKLPQVEKALDQLGIDGPVTRLKTFARCRFTSYSNTCKSCPYRGCICVDDSTSAHITNREVEVITLLKNGVNYRQIARQIDISENCVKQHMFNIKRKLNITNQAQVGYWAAKCGL